MENVRTDHPNITGQTMVALLRCMPSLQVLTLHSIGNIHSNIHVACESLTQLHMTRCVIGVNTLLVMLIGMPSLPELTFAGVDVVGDPEIEISGSCDKLERFEMFTDPNGIKKITDHDCLVALYAITSGLKTSLSRYRRYAFIYAGNVCITHQVRYRFL